MVGKSCRRNKPVERCGWPVLRQACCPCLCRDILHPSEFIMKNEIEPRSKIIFLSSISTYLVTEILPQVVCFVNHNSNLPTLQTQQLICAGQRTRRRYMASSTGIMPQVDLTHTRRYLSEINMSPSWIQARKKRWTSDHSGP